MKNIYINKLCGKNIKCNNCSEFTGYAGDDCDYVSAKYNKETRNIGKLIIFILIVAIIFIWVWICIAD